MYTAWHALTQASWCLLHIRCCHFYTWAQAHGSRGAHMAWKSWRVGELPLDPRGFPIPVWKHLLPDFPDVSRKVKLALPCIGAHALGAGLRGMHWQGVKFSYAWDVSYVFAAISHGCIWADRSRRHSWRHRLGR